MAGQGKCSKRQRRLTDVQKWRMTERINRRKDRNVRVSSHGKFLDRASMVRAGGGTAILDEKTMRWSFYQGRKAG